MYSLLLMLMCSGYAMQQPLPIGQFKWVPERQHRRLLHRLLLAEGDDDRIGVDDVLGYILEVDLDYPASLHDDHNDLPLAPEKVRILESMLSDYCRTYEGVDFKSSEKLVPNLRPKRNYVLHYRNLQLYVRLGMVVTKVHRVLEFAQRWMAKYINVNTDLRKEAKSVFEKDFFKLANNAVYGIFNVLLFKSCCQVKS